MFRWAVRYGLGVDVQPGIIALFRRGLPNAWAGLVAAGR
jgi:hypothetical protein